MFKKIVLVLALAFASNVAFAAPVTFQSTPKKIPATAAPAQTNCDKLFGTIKGYLAKDQLPSTDADVVKYALSSNTLLHDAWTKDPELGAYESLQNALAAAKGQGLSPEIKAEVCKQVDAVTAGASDDDIKKTAWFVLFEYALKESFFDVARGFDWRTSPLNPAAMQDMIGSMLPAVQGKKLGSQDLLDLAKKGGGGLGGLGNQYNTGWLGSMAACVSDAGNSSSPAGVMGHQGIGGDPQKDVIVVFGGKKKKKNPLLDKDPEKQIAEGVPGHEGAAHGGYDISLCMAMSPIAAGGVGEGPDEPQKVGPKVFDALVKAVDAQKAADEAAAKAREAEAKANAAANQAAEKAAKAKTKANDAAINAVLITAGAALKAKAEAERLEIQAKAAANKAKELEELADYILKAAQAGGGVKKSSPESDDLASCATNALSAMLGCIGTWGGNVAELGCKKSFGPNDSPAFAKACDCKGAMTAMTASVTPTEDAQFSGACGGISQPPANYKDFLVDPSPEAMQVLIQASGQPTEVYSSPAGNEAR